MGYSYDMRGRLACDNCGVAGSGNVRKRTCPHKVLGDSRHGARYALPYCYAPALCSACYKSNGGLRGVHGAKCADGAKAMQAEADAIEAGLEAGGSYVGSAFGDWADDVPKGMAGVIFRDRAGSETRVLVPAGDYDPSGKPWLADYPGAAPWPDKAAPAAGRVTTKRVSFRVTTRRGPA